MLAISTFKPQASSVLAVFGFIAGLTTAIATGGAQAAGGHSGGHGHGHGLAFGEGGKAAQASRTIEVTMYDNYFEPEKIQVKAGETVRFLVKNEGEFVHEFNIGTAAMHAAHHKEMEMMVEHGVLEADKINHHMMNMDMGGGRTMKHDEPNSVLLEPGQTGEVVLKFTNEMALEFACNVPGHYDSGMMGYIEFRK